MAKYFLSLWAILSALIALELYRLHRNPEHSMLFYLQTRHLLKAKFDLSPDPGRTLSLWFGYVGFGLMLLTNLYIIRKRLNFFRQLGVLKNWLDFHIFCGLMGPTLILFHCDFKVRGLVAISFWSMIVSLSSGIVGRYVYTQISKLKGDFVREAEAYNRRISALIEHKELEISEEELAHYRTQALEAAGGRQVSNNPMMALTSSLIGDVKMRLLSTLAPAAMGPAGELFFREYAVNMRKANTVDSFNRLMGYWHTFHTPFAVFMYLAAVLHIAAEFWLGAA